MVNFTFLASFSSKGVWIKSPWKSRSDTKAILHRSLLCRMLSLSSHLSRRRVIPANVAWLGNADRFWVWTYSLSYLSIIYSLRNDLVYRTLLNISSHPWAPRIPVNFDNHKKERDTLKAANYFDNVRVFPCKDFSIRRDECVYCSEFSTLKIFISREYSFSLAICHF